VAEGKNLRETLRSISKRIGELYGLIDGDAMELAESLLDFKRRKIQMAVETLAKLQKRASRHD
jgi:hypothetical protein